MQQKNYHISQKATQNEQIVVLLTGNIQSAILKPAQTTFTFLSRPRVQTNERANGRAKERPWAGVRQNWREVAGGGGGWGCVSEKVEGPRLQFRSHRVRFWKRLKCFREKNIVLVHKSSHSDNSSSELSFFLAYCSFVLYQCFFVCSSMRNPGCGTYFVCRIIRL